MRGSERSDRKRLGEERLSNNSADELAEQVDDLAAKSQRATAGGEFWVMCKNSLFAHLTPLFRAQMCIWGCFAQHRCLLRQAGLFYDSKLDEQSAGLGVVTAEVAVELGLIF